MSNRELAETYHLNRHTVAKWRQREGLADASHRHHRLQVTLGAAQETVVVALRSSFLLPLDDLLANSSTPRSRVDVKSLPQMPDEDQRQYLFTAINRAMRWVYVELLQDKSAASASGFLKRLIENARFTINKVLPDNGKKFTDRFCATGAGNLSPSAPRDPEFSVKYDNSTPPLPVKNEFFHSQAAQERDKQLLGTPFDIAMCR